MQNVAWPMTIVDEAEADPDRHENVSIVAFSAIPVTIPGSAIGSTTRNEIVSRPKKR